MDDELGNITVERRDHLLLIGIDRTTKLNGFTPEMMDALVDAYTRLDDDPDLWVGVVFAHGDHFTAGLDLPRWAEPMKRSGRRDAAEGVASFVEKRPARFTGR